MVEIPTTSSNASARTAIRQARRRFKVFVNELSATRQAVSESMGEELAKEVQTNYDSFVSGLSHDHQDRSDTIINSYKTDRGCVVVARGSQVLYDEFGTGDRGLMNPHPDKGKYSLNDYNSGSHIKLDKDGSFYWTYYSTKDGKYTSSHGVPAGMFMYKSFENIANGIAANIVFNEYSKAMRKIGKGT